MSDEKRGISLLDLTILAIWFLITVSVVRFQADRIVRAIGEPRHIVQIDSTKACPR